MDQKKVADFVCIAVAGYVVIGIILAVRMPKEETPKAFASWAKLLPNRQAIDEANAC